MTRTWYEFVFVSSTYNGLGPNHFQSYERVDNTLLWKPPCMYAGVSRTRIVPDDNHCLKSGTYIASVINVHAFPYRGNNEGTQVERNSRAKTWRNICVPPFTGPRRRQEPIDIIFIFNIIRVFYDPGKIKNSDVILHVSAMHGSVHCYSRDTRRSISNTKQFYCGLYGVHYLLLCGGSCIPSSSIKSYKMMSGCLIGSDLFATI